MQNDNFAHNSAQHCAIKFCVKLEELASVIFEKLKQAYGKHSLSRAQVFCWHKSILKGREHIEDEQRTHWRWTLFREAFNFENWWKHWKCEHKFWLNICTCKRSMPKWCWKPHNWAEGQSKNKCLDFLDRITNQYDPETKKQVVHCEFSFTMDFRNDPKVCNRHAENHTSWRLPVLLPKVEMSPLVYSCPRELFWRG